MLKKIQKKIVLKFLVALLLIIFSVGSLSLIYFYNSITETWDNYLQNQIDNTMNFVKIVYSEPLWNMNEKTVHNINQAILKDKFVIAVNVFTLGKFWTGHEDLLDNKGKAHRIYEPFSAKNSDASISSIKQVIDFGGEPVGEVEVYYSKDAVESAILLSNIEMALSFLIIAVILVVFILLFFRILIVQPIFSLQKRLSMVAAGNFDQQLQLKSKDEIGMLCKSFNRMLFDLRKAYRDLEKSENRFRFLFEHLQEAITKNDFTTRVSKNSGDDDLTESVNRILETLEASDQENKKQTWLKTGQTEFNNQIAGKKDISELAQSAINFLSKYLNAQVGAMYIADPDEDYLHLRAGYAFEQDKANVKIIKPGQGLVGQAALEKKRILFSDIPDDYIRISSGLGETLPKNLLVQAVVHEQKVMGVFELGSVQGFSQDHYDLLDSIKTNLAISIQSMLFNERLQNLLDTTRAQSEELRQHQAQLEEANEELEEQTQQLKNSEDRLKEQREELRANNEELEEKTQELEEKNQELQEKNQALDEQKIEIENKSAQLEKKQKETEQRAEELQKATKYKSEFLANMSHELRSPLNSMLLLSRMLAEDDNSNLSADQIESAHSIHRSGQNLLNLINDILDLAKIESRKMQLNPSKVDLNSLIENIRSEFKPLAKEKGLEFAIQVEDELPRSLFTDQVRLEQIIRNLVSNAIKFTDKGHVQVKIARPEMQEIVNTDLDARQSIAISVIDTGVGIPEDRQKDVFEAFQQADGSISRSYGGTGLGLSICSELSHLLQGEIRLWSNVSQGSTFVVYLPETLNLEQKDKSDSCADKICDPETKPVLKAENTEKSESEPEDEQKGKAGVADLKNRLKQKEVLIIEDDLDFAEIVGKAALLKGFTYHICARGKEGIRYALNNKSLAVILDLGLPDIDGWTVLRELKDNSETRHIPVHIISAADKTQQGLQSGALGYLTKPVQKEELDQVFEKIESLISAKLKELLVVEDEPELQQSIQKLLKTADINITSSFRGLEAYELLKTKKFDCIILDLGLPDISGFELLDRISADETIPKIPTIIYTGRDLSKEETERLNSYSASIVLKSAMSTDRLLDETTLFLHQVEAQLPEEQQKMIRKLHDKESICKGKTVLVVDDDMRNAFALSKFLKSRGMEVFIASNGKKALEMLDENSGIDIVLMDIMMPEMDGYEAMKQIRSQKRFKDLPMLALTAKAMKTDKEEAIASGANDYLSKPVDVAKLLGMLRVWLY